MKMHITSRTGYDRWVSLEEELTIMVGQDGAALISLPDAYCNERLLSPEQTELAILDIRKEQL